MILPLLARIIAPPSCLICCREGAVVCASCRPPLIHPPPPSCFRCNKNIKKGTVCAQCRPLTALDGVVTAAAYGGTVRELVQRLKYRRLREAATVLADLLTPLLTAADYDAVTAVPVATNRLRHRGYNQAELIARRLAANLQLPYRPLLRRQRNTQQVGKSRRQRLQEVEGAFRATPGAHGLRVLVVDDVLTTGATLNACATALQAAGATSVWGATPARDL